MSRYILAWLVDFNSLFYLSAAAFVTCGLISALITLRLLLETGITYIDRQEDKLTKTERLAVTKLL